MTGPIFRFLLVGALIGVVLFALHPVNNTFLRLALLGCVAASWGGFLILMWRRNVVRLVLLLLPLVVVVPLVLPGSRIDPAELRGDYVRRMAEYDGTVYDWGGESSRGIDCSGLPRRALRDALFAYGVRHGNGSAFRTWLEHWWFDASALALSEGYRDYTTPLAPVGTIREMDFSGLLPGDLAVTASGVHILAYVGDEMWIQADSGIGAVATLNGRTDSNVWFSQTVTTHRWQVFEEE